MKNYSALQTDYLELASNMIKNKEIEMYIERIYIDGRKEIWDIRKLDILFL